VRKTVPDAVNPLLIGQNLRERLDEGLIDQRSFGAAMAELKHAVRLARLIFASPLTSALWRPGRRDSGAPGMLCRAASKNDSTAVLTSQPASLLEYVVWTSSACSA
jgi:hypothetical protein